MAIYIKDMEMPVDCLACRIACDKENYMVIGRPPTCPLIEVSELIKKAEAIEAMELMGEAFLGEKERDAIIRGIMALPFVGGDTNE